MLSETHWKENYIPKFNAYQSFYLNRQSQGGGVAILIKKNIQATPILLPQTADFEAVGITMRLKNNKLLDLISIYCPNGNNCTYQEWRRIAESTTNSTIMAGDLNAPSNVWEQDRQQNKSGKIITEYLANEDKLILCTPKDLGTRPSNNGNQPSTIDLTFESQDLASLITVRTGPYWGSDHLPVMIDLDLNTSTNSAPNDHLTFQKDN